MQHNATEAVPVRTIANVLAAQPSLRTACFGAVKVDVEGFEASALAGMLPTFEGPCPPCAVFFEFNGDYSRRAGHPGGPFRMLTALGYTCRDICGGTPAAPFPVGDYRCDHRRGRCRAADRDWAAVASTSKHCLRRR